VRASKLHIATLLHRPATAAKAISERHIAVSQCIAAHSREVLAAVDALQEDSGVLYCYPIADHVFSVKLCYNVSGAANSRQLYHIEFNPQFFEQFSADVLEANQPFRFDRTAEEHFPVCAKATELLGALFDPDEGNTLPVMLQRSNYCVSLLARALECLATPFAACQVPACRFLGYSAERERIDQAIEVIERNIANPLTIKELARKVAINECYLKKGFKTVTGQTIHEFQLGLRIARAKHLLSTSKLTVTEVAAELGFSSISHFSTAFKRATGMKPCELLS
jgi:AraC-like DNA-binding protein